MAHGGRRQSSAKVNILLNLIFHEMFIKVNSASFFEERKITKGRCFNTHIQHALQIGMLLSQSIFRVIITENMFS